MYASLFPNAIRSYPVLHCRGAMILLGGLLKSAFVLFAAFCYLNYEHVFCITIRKGFPEYVAEISDKQFFKRTPA